MSKHKEKLAAKSPDTLTEIESKALESEYGLADGHAYQDLQVGQRQITKSLPEIWKCTTSKVPRDLEREFADLLFRLAGQHSVRNYENFHICPSASCSIDIVGAFLRAKRLKASLLHPTFDNLALLWHRREVPLQPIDERRLVEDPCSRTLNSDSRDVVFLVHPNNPTGNVFTLEKLQEIIDWCSAHHKTLVFDHSFRFFGPTNLDLYERLLQSRVSFIGIEDTGKTWPTQDQKASVLIFSKDLQPALTEIYQEIFLGTSPFVLGILMAFVQDTLERGLDACLWSTVRENRTLLRKALEGTILAPHKGSENSTLSVDWLEIKSNRLNDLELTAALERFGIVVLPGRYFYWANHKKGVHSIRVALLKPNYMVKQGIRRLREGLLQLAA